MTYVSFLLLGLGNGAVFAALGLTLAIAYKSSGVVNFGAGSMALLGAVFYWSLRTQHAIFNPLALARPLTYAAIAVCVVVGAVRLRKSDRRSLRQSAPTFIAIVAGLVLTALPTEITVGNSLSTPLALIGAVVLTGIIGWALYDVVFQRLRTALPLTKAVASIGVLAVIPTIVDNRMGANTIDVPPLLPATVWRSHGLLVQERQLLMASAIVVVALVLGYLYRRTRFGLQTQISAETQIGATVLGISPNMIGRTNWAICGSVSGLFGALIVTFAPVAPGDFALFVVPALAAAMIGGMSSLTWVTVAGLGMGMLQSEALDLTTRYSWLPQQGFGDFVPLLLLIVVMLVRDKPLPERGTLTRRMLPSAPAPRNVSRWLVGLSALCVLLILTLHGDFQEAIATSLIAFLFALSVVVLTGFAGQISLGQYMFVGVAAFFLSRLTETWGVPFPVAPLIAVVAGSLLGALMSFPALRVRGVNLAILTLSIALTAEDFYFSNASYVGQGGSPTVPDPKLFGLQLGIGTADTYPRVDFSLMLLIVVIPVVLAVVGLRRSSFGLQMLAVRANERAAAANGINVSRVKMLAFTISAGIAALGGVFTAYYNYEGFSSSTFDVFLSVTLVAVVFVAGISTISGAVLAGGVLSAGGLFTVLLGHALPKLSAWYPALAGLALISNAIVLPDGIAGWFGKRTWTDIREDLAMARWVPGRLLKISEAGEGVVWADGAGLAGGSDREPSEAGVER